ncbi:MAG: hypothetical protein LBN95_00220 [Prevotellaceae bacterium]|jgi:hypothetical protein|nr:hypothetical protein [Prevotellaceae bacterium]
MNNNKEKIKGLLFSLIIVLCFFAVLLSREAILYNRNNKEAEINFEILGRDTEGTIIGYKEGYSGFKGPKKGYYNLVKFCTEDSIVYRNMWTSKEPIFNGTKVMIRYYIDKTGKLRIKYTDFEKFKDLDTETGR